MKFPCHGRLSLRVQYILNYNVYYSIISDFINDQLTRVQSIISMSAKEKKMKSHATFFTVPGTLSSPIFLLIICYNSES